MGRVILSLLSLLGTWRWEATSDVIGRIDHPENIQQIQISGSSLSNLTVDWVTALGDRRHVDQMTAQVVDEKNALFDLEQSSPISSGSSASLHLRDCQFEEEDTLTCITSEPGLPSAETIYETFKRTSK